MLIDISPPIDATIAVWPGDTPFARTVSFPFVKTIGGNKASPANHRRPERGLVQYGVSAGIDEQGERPGVLHPRRQQTPAHQSKLTLSLPYSDDRNGLGRRNIVARRKIWQFRIAK